MPRSPGGFEPKFEIEEKEESREVEIKKNEKEEAAEAEDELERTRKKVENIQDKLGKPVEEKIKETVVMLTAFDMRTTQSCEGHLEKERIQAPWVMILPEEPPVKKWHENKELREKVRKQGLAMRKKLINLLTNFYREKKATSDIRLGVSERVGYGFKVQSEGVQALEGLNKKDQKKRVREYRKEMKEFTKFLKENYPDYLFKRLKI